MDSIQVQCGQCKRRFSAKAHLAGKRVKCPGCQSPITIPEPNVVTAVEVMCHSCRTDYLAESSDLGRQMPCPSCGSLNTVVEGGAGALQDDPFASNDPLFRPAAAPSASPFAPTQRTATLCSNVPFGASSTSQGPSFLARHWLSGVVAGVALISLMLCLVAGHLIIGAVLFMGGVAVAASGFVFPPPKKRSARTSKSSGNKAVAAVSSTAGVLFFVGMAVLRILGRMNRRGQLDGQEWIGPLFAGLFALVLVVGAIGLFVYLVTRFGVFRTGSAFYFFVALAAPILLIALAPNVGGGPEGGAGGGLAGGPPGAPSGGPASAPSVPAQALTEAQFPALGVGRAIVPGVDFHEVHLPVPRQQPGHANKLHVLIPQGSHEPKSLPCVFITGAGAIPLTGMILAEEDHPEQIPYAEAGFVVVAYEIDGYMPDAQNATDAQFVQVWNAYRAADAGLVNARNAIDFALARIPAVDPQRLYTAGHSSAATQALLLAENDTRIRGCIAYAPVVDLRADLSEDLPILRSMLNDFDTLLNRASPRTGETRLNCPVFLFHALDDDVVPASESTGMAQRLRSMRKSVELVTVNRGGHYNSMISQGIPKGIEWLKKLAGPMAQPGIAAADPSSGGLADAGSPSPGLGSSSANPSIGSESLNPDDGGSTLGSGTGELMAASSGSDASPFREVPAGTGDMSGEVGDAEIQRLLAKITSNNIFEQRDALKELAKLDPARVASDEARQGVVAKLNELVLGTDHFTRAEAIKALATWGDASSVSVLVGILADKSNRGLSGDIYTALGRLKEPSSAITVAERLGDFFDRDKAEACLRQMGEVAEDALILAAPALNKDGCLRALRLLGDVGSEKCFDVLREAQRSRDVEIRETGKLALRKIRYRQNAEAGDGAGTDE